MKKVLLCSLSPSPKDASYYLADAGEGRFTVQASQSPLALVQLLPKKDLPSEIKVLCTQKIEASVYDQFVQNLKAVWHGRNEEIPFPTLNKISIPDGTTYDEIWEIINRIMNEIEPGYELTLDITHGFRSYPFLFFVAALYLQKLKGVEIKAVYYGMVEGPAEDKPLVNLSIILEMIEWFYAVRFFKETGQAHLLAELLEPCSKAPAEVKGGERKPYGEVEAIHKGLKVFSSFYGQGLPFELGDKAYDVHKKMENNEYLEVIKKRVPLAQELMDNINGYLDSIALEKRLRKNSFKLQKAEIERQTRLIGMYLDQGYVAQALGLIREWMITVLLYHNYSEDKLVGKGWIHSDGLRDDVERWLGSQLQLKKEYNRLRKREGSEAKLPIVEKLARKLEPHSWLIDKWDFFSQSRNKLMHQGYQLDHVDIDIESVLSSWKELEGTFDDREKWAMPKPAGDRLLLLNPLGMSPGALYSAIKHMGDALYKVWVITSEQAAEKIDEVILKAEYKGNIEIHLVADPFTAFRAAPGFYEKIMFDALEADRVVINITGGTTALQHVVQETTDRLKNIGIQVERVALIDRRPVEEQKKNPYVLGEIIYLDRDMEHRTASE